MPEAEENARGKGCLPVGLGGYNLVDKLEEPLWLIIGLDINIEFHVLVSGLKKKR